MGVALQQSDAKSYHISTAVVDQYGELIDHAAFTHLLFQERKPRQGENPKMGRQPDIEEKKKFQDEKDKILELIQKHEIKLVVVSADCLEARKLKKILTQWVSS
mmetsp:Transcript_11706/g.17791  ORF Transcript_11706/g.17791 Transcript_11706/m.17791 type:complete len:104 (+) Transcript_11706:1801-2112(+)